MSGASRGLPRILPLIGAPPDDPGDLALKEWPRFSFDACPGFLGDFVRLATRDSEADPAAICVTTLVRFGAEVYGHAQGQGPHIYVGETVHPARLFAVLCGNTSKARKGTSRHPVTKLFGREHCQPADLEAWGLPLPARESGGPLSTGEGLAHHVRDESDEDRERRKRQNPSEPLREKGDRRLIIIDEEFASGLACTKREGNTLSMGIRCLGFRRLCPPDQKQSRGGAGGAYLHHHPHHHTGAGRVPGRGSGRQRFREPVPVDMRPAFQAGGLALQDAGQ